MPNSRRAQAAQIIQRRILTLIPRAVAAGTTVTVERHYTQLGQPASDSWTGDLEGFSQRVAIALYGSSDPDAADDLQTALRDRLGDALISAGAVPATMPIEVHGQAGVLADAVLPVTRQAARQAALTALATLADLFDDRGNSLLDGGILTAAETAALVRRHAGHLATRDEEHTAEEFLAPRTDRSYWVTIEAALNTALAAGIPIGIDLDGTLTDHNAWSLVWDRITERWTIAGYQDGFEATAASEQKDTHTGSQPVWAGFTAREEIIGVLISAGYNEAAAKELLGRADHEPRAQATDDEFEATLAGGHALVLESGDCEFYGSCQCGKRFGTVTPDKFRDGVFTTKWERHVMTEASS
ncbi:hypothetical protein [Streptomyces sp. DSM 40484]|uniref:hypothetical protein n=1 Tax=Streptomyces kroppenstedtii TaxID=3051181 RepID=UPI0028D7C89B|nr:hypothetical protein [Streptomyces sp. DSM 40484]